MAVTKSRMQTARKRAHALKAHVPKAVAARYDAASKALVVQLEGGVYVGFPTTALQGLENAKAQTMRRIEISPSGYGIHVPALDADFYLPALLEGIFGTREFMAERGRRGGRAVSSAKKTAAQANGKLGGRPRKVTGEVHVA